jgi:hypothetical protein
MLTVHRRHPVGRVGRLSGDPWGADKGAQLNGAIMISENCTIGEFVEAVKDKGSGEVIALAVEEATRADRMFYRACRCSGDHCSCEDKYSRHLKRLIGYLRYSVKPKRRNDEVYQLYTAHWGNA